METNIFEPVAIATHTRECGVVLKVIEHVYFDTGLKFWDLVIYQNKESADLGFYKEGVVIDCNNISKVMKLFTAIKNTPTL